MEQKSVLAQVFVPSKLRDINMQGAALLPTSIASTAQNNRHWELLRSQLVPHPETLADRHQFCALRVIPPQIFEADLYYAIHPSNQPGGNNNNNNNKTPTPKKKSTNGKAAKNGKARGEVAVAAADAEASAPQATLDNVSNLSEYCMIWEELLWVERKRLLALYERYAKYNMVVRKQPDAPRSQAFVDIAGIADASPTLHPGDTVLVRTSDLVRLPPHMERIAVPHVVTQRTVHCAHPQHVELRCMLELVTRHQHDVGRAAGRVHFTWTNDANHNFLEAFQPRYPASRLYNVRFVPSWEPTIACLSALDWLRSLSDRHAHDLFHTLLFPTSAPVLPSENRSLLLMHETSFMNGTSSNGDANPSSALNSRQHEFCRLVERRARHPSFEAIREPLICSGPAGTGKTQTMLHAVYQLLQADGDSVQQDNPQQHAQNGGGPSLSPSRKQLYRILICTPSHTAADVITRRLGRECSKFLNRSTLFRLYSPNRPLATVPVDVLQYARQTSDTGEFCLPHDAASLLNFRVIVCTCQDAHLLYRVGLTNAQLRVRRQNFERYLQDACRDYQMYVHIDGVNHAHWTHLFIDEAAQATEPESLIPLSLVVDPEPGIRKAEICLVGDPRQLSPNVYSASSDGTGGPNDLSRSWMERLLLRPVTALGGGQPHLLGPSLVDMQELMEYSCRESLSVFLTLNYRGHSSFLMMPSALFYFDKLQSAYVPHPTISNTTWCRTLRMVEGLSNPVMLPLENGEGTEIPLEVRPKKQFDWPIHFRGVSGRDQAITVSEGFTSQSWTNEDEARVVTEIVQNLVTEGVAVSSIGVMSPFRGQVVRIREWLRKAFLNAINVGTIEDYQSVERDVIVLSLTRSTPDFVPNDVASRVGVFGQPKRSNVALTRAEHMFIVVGNPAVMVHDPIWKQFLHFCLRNGMFYGDPCGTLPQLAWNEKRHIVRCRPERSSTGMPPPSSSEEMAASESVDDDLVIISTLEHKVRNGKS